MTLSYALLYDLVRRERSHQELQELAPTFYADARQFMHVLASEARIGSLSAAEQARVQLVNTRKLLKQLYEYRESKLLHLAQYRCKTGSSMVDTSKLLAPEKEVYEQLVRILSEQRVVLGIDDLFALPLTVHAAPDEEEKEATSVPAAPQEERVTIRVVKAVPAFVGKSMETYGPFSENERVDLPAPVAQVLIRKGSAARDADSE